MVERAGIVAILYEWESVLFPYTKILFEQDQVTHFFLV